MPGTVLPLFLLPDVCWVHAPYAPTLEGQYIIKNLVLISAGLVIGATVRGGRLIADPAALPAETRTPHTRGRGDASAAA
jgi:hypothetical protein